MSKYKHISNLEKYEGMVLFVENDDLVDMAIERAAASTKEEKIDNHLIKDEFYRLLKDLDEVIDTETYERYTKVKQGDD